LIVKVALLCTLLSIAGIAVPAAAQAVAESYQLNIPKQPLDAALKDLAQQTGLQIGRSPDGRERIPIVGPVSGEMSVDKALRTLLSPTRFTFRVVNDTTIAVLSLDAPSPSDAPTVSNPNAQPSTSGANQDQKEGKKNSSDGFRVAQVDEAPAGAQIAQGHAASTQSGQLQEVVVTAQKREEKLQDVPVPVTVLSADSLLESNQLRLQDYYATVPGFTVTPSGSQSVTVLSIRGITTGGGTNPTVGIMVDDVPYGASTGLGGADLVPDIDPGDLARIEVLRGPQGTLYGASSMGGLLKFVTADPSTESVSGRVQTGIETIYNGANPGYNVRGSINVPLSDTLALRASGFVRQDPGYIDNPVLDTNGINKHDASGGHLSALWRPSDAFSLKVSALVQQIKSDGSDDIERAIHV
jgi:TonB-dependent receptor-like protein